MRITSSTCWPPVGNSNIAGRISNAPAAVAPLGSRTDCNKPIISIRVVQYNALIVLSYVTIARIIYMQRATEYTLNNGQCSTRMDISTNDKCRTFREDGGHADSGITMKRPGPPTFCTKKREIFVPSTRHSPQSSTRLTTVDKCMLYSYSYVQSA